MERITSVFRWSSVALLGIALCCALSYCAKTEPKDALEGMGVPTPTPTETPLVTPTPTETPQSEWDVTELDEKIPDEDAQLLALARENLKTVYFEYDQSSLTPESKRDLEHNAGWIKQNPDYFLLIEGHCDERGTEEYNLALGQRRAASTRSYLVALGVKISSMTILSYGEEKPADPGSDEDAWAKNRRAEFKLRK